MNDPFYEFTSLNNTTRFDFLSIGKREIHKAVIYSQSADPQIFFLSLANVSQEDLLDFVTTSNNGDLKVVLATVVQTLITFLDIHPTVMVAFTGNTPSRSRLYNILISQELDQVSANFLIFGIKGDRIELFTRNSCYDSFLISRKNVNID
ncbi:hypothetical protein L0663_07745 [Dyadobacter sp. CY107]|uniref:DUF6934 family protein n=1 Tax=Dyadobacter fanqingshengii TaxID=2906443 RepID=UPI001F2F43D8|nr:hypothetical protein [Dyadobacter fanqingshengii]MCF2503263.1 hypothetical protein [Dyadobacter fanqingshengii]